MAGCVKLPAELQMFSESGEQASPIVRKNILLMRSIGLGPDYSRRQDCLTNCVARAIAAQRVEGQCSAPARQPSGSTEWIAYPRVCRELSCIAADAFDQLRYNPALREQ